MVRTRLMIRCQSAVRRVASTYSSPVRAFQCHILGKFGLSQDEGLIGFEPSCPSGLTAHIDGAPPAIRAIVELAAPHVWFEQYLEAAARAERTNLTANGRIRRGDRAHLHRVDAQR